MGKKEAIQVQGSNKGEIILYQPDNSVQLEVRVEDDTVWLTQAQMVILFERERTVITKHINNIFNEGELDEKSNVQILHIPLSDKPVKLYNLDVIISVGYRVKSHRGILFRKWATKTLKEHILKGYTIHQRFERIEHRVAETEQKIDFFVKTSLPPKEGISHDRFLFIDNDVYHIGASLKDLGAKWFAFSKMGIDAERLLGQLTTMS